MYKLKQVINDFVVSEVPFEFEPGFGYLLVWMEKKDYTSLRAVEVLARFFRIRVKDVGFAGNKDKRAVTRQIVSLKGVAKDSIKNFKHKNIMLEFYGNSSVPVSLGDLKANYFKVVVRNLDSEPRDRNWFVNYFDEQRFSKNNIEAGRALVKGDFKKFFEVSGFPGGSIQDLQKMRRPLLIYVHAFQSYLWNQTVARYLEKFEHKRLETSFGELIFPLDKVDNKSVPLVGFDLPDSEFSGIIEGLLDKEKLFQRDFINRQLNFLSLEGGFRDLVVEVKDLFLNVETDELNEGKKKAVVSFELPKGSYATMFIKHIIV